MERASVQGELDEIRRKTLNITWLNQLAINLLICSCVLFIFKNYKDVTMHTPI